MILDGRIAAKTLLEKLKSQLKTLPRPALLSIIQDAGNPASDLYIEMKMKAAASLGIEIRHLKDSFQSKSGILKLVEEQQNDRDVTGVLVQLPLMSPGLKGFESELLTKLRANKDADGLGLQAQGALFTGSTHPDHWTCPIAATPLGIYRLLEHYKIPIMGKKIAILGRSRLVGKPLGQIFLQSHASVLQLHSKSVDVEDWISTSDIVVVAIGRPTQFSLRLKKSAVLIDVGIHREDQKTVGDCSLDSQRSCASYSPVPGGVGPMTVACLMENVTRLALSHHKL